MLLRQLRLQREALLWKCEGLSERDLRMPRSVTGTNLLGLVKHCAMVEHEYFVSCFGRASGIALPHVDDDEPNADLYASADESAEDLLALYRAVGEEVEEAVTDMDIDTPGRVPWWGENGDTTLGFVLVHVLGDISRHAGQADILREDIDGSVGFRTTNTNLWEPDGGWEPHVARLRALADESS